MTQTDWFRLRTVRVVLIARVGNYEKDYIFPASTITVWGPVDPFGNRALTPDLSPNPVTYTVPDLHYRYKVITMVIPIRNMFWKP